MRLDPRVRGDLRWWWHIDRIAVAAGHARPILKLWVAQEAEREVYLDDDPSVVTNDPFVFVQSVVPEQTCEARSVGEDVAAVLNEEGVIVAFVGVGD